VWLVSKDSAVETIAGGDSVMASIIGRVVFEEVLKASGRSDESVSSFDSLETADDDVEGTAPVGGSGRSSILGTPQSGHVQVRESVARRFRSAIGYSTAPTPMAASPFSGKNPCNPMIAVRTPQAGCHNSS